MTFFRNILLLAVAMLLVGKAWAAEVSVTADKTSVEIGDSISIQIRLVGFPTTHGGGVDVRFNNQVLQAGSVSINPIWNFANRNGIVDNRNGVISNIFFSHFNGVEGDLPVATISMTAVGAGPANIIVSESPQNPFAGPQGALAATIINTAQAVQVAGVPADNDNADKPADQNINTDTVASSSEQDAAQNETAVVAEAESGTQASADSASNSVQSEPSGNQQRSAAPFVIGSGTGSASNGLAAGDVSSDAGRADGQGVEAGQQIIQIHRLDNNRVNNNGNGSFGAVAGSQYQGETSSNSYQNNVNPADTVSGSLGQQAIEGVVNEQGSTAGQSSAVETDEQSDSDSDDSSSNVYLLSAVAALVVIVALVLVFK